MCAKLGQGLERRTIGGQEMPFSGCLLSSTFWGNWKFNYSLPLSGIPVGFHPRRMRLDHSIVLARGSIVLRNVHVVFPLTAPLRPRNTAGSQHSPSGAEGLACVSPKHLCYLSPHAANGGGGTGLNVSTSSPFSTSILQHVTHCTAPSGKPSCKL